MNNFFFNQYSSKIKRVEVTLPGFNFSHAPYSDENKKSLFIGREDITNQLKNWLEDDNGNTKGAYLITGYRGMGKSSFVGKVIEKVKEKYKSDNLESENNNENGFLNRIKNKKEIRNGIFYLLPYILISILLWQVPTKYLVLLVIIPVGFLIYFFRTEPERPVIDINLNLGGELSGERDILSLISNSLFGKINFYHKYTYHKSTRQVRKRIAANSFICVIASLIYLFLFPAINNAFQESHSINSNIFHDLVIYLNLVLLKIRLKLDIFASLLGILICFIISYFIWEYVLVRIGIYFLQYLGVKNPILDSIIKRIKFLNDRIDSSVSEDQNPSGQMNVSILSLSLKKQKTHVYQQATVREIEQELIQIINDISEFTRLIIVLDELDKVKVDFAKGGDNVLTDGATPDFGYANGGIPGEVSTHTKKQNVLFLLTQLKYFISTAEAKFIFISGRELYDAFLADASDREFFVSSIFNGVINVNSFLSCDEDNSEKDITVMTERYLCKLLIDSSWKNSKGENPRENELTLKTYYEYLIRKNYKVPENTIVESDIKKLTPKVRVEIEKTIILLRYFVTYLTYVSNGAPKKITTHIEKFIVKHSKGDKGENIIDVSCPKYKKGEEYFLSFGYKEQQKIGFIYYIATPIFHNIINRASEYSDKLLISSSFLISHIYKHHSNGFSWRNLEYIPELIEKHRTPELRDFIQSIISFLKQAHLSTITCGLYQMKFPKRISEEISIMSRRHEDILATFNFSLDDSRSVRMYYSKLLAYYEKKGASSRHTRANIYIILGDLDMADEEYTEAIGKYRNAVSLLASFDTSKYPSNVSEAHASLHIILQVRAMLKLGLAHEKRKTIDSALLTYSELVNKLLAHRYIDETQLKLKYKVESSEDWYGKKAILYKDNSPYSYGEQSVFDRKIYPQLIDDNEKANISYWIYGDEVIPKLSQQLTPEKAGIVARLSVYEDLNLAYLPSLAKLFALEKVEMGGITLENIEVVESEFRYLHLATNFKDKYIISADFFRKLGDILYYKNSLMGHKSASFNLLLQTWGYDIKSEIFDHCVSNRVPMESTKKLMDIFDQSTNNFKDLIDKDPKTKFEESVKVLNILKSDEFIKKVKRKIELFGVNGNGKEKTKDCAQRLDNCFENLQNNKKPCFACRYYSRSLTTLGKYVIKDFLSRDGVPRNSSKSVQFLEAIETDLLYTYEENTMTQIAFTLEAMGNVMVSCSGKGDHISIHFIFHFIKVLDQKPIYSKIKPKNQLEKSVLYFWTAAKFHGKASNLKESYQCYVKIIKIFIAFIKNGLSNEEGHINFKGSKGLSNSTKANPESPKTYKLSNLKIDNFCEKLEEKIVKRAIIRVYSNREFSNMEDLQEIKWTFSREMYENINLEHLSLMPDIEEILYAFYEMKIRLKRELVISKNFRDEIKKIYQSDLLNNLRKESTVYSRIHALFFKSFLNRTVFNELVEGYDIKLTSDKELIIYDLVQIAEFISKIIEKPEPYKTIAQEYFGEKPDDRNIREKLSLLEFLVIDSLFCQMEILEILGPVSKTTLFTNSFTADISVEIMQWNKIYETIYIMYRMFDGLMEIGSNGNAGVSENKLKEIEKKCDDLKKKNKIEIEQNDATSFFEDLLKAIGKHNIHYTSDNYFAEMAIKRYEKAQQMHSEGQAYKDFISNFYLLNDDLQNNTCQFSFAIERYYLNTGNVANNIKRLKEMFKEKRMYKASNYLMTNSGGKYYAERKL